MPAYACIQRASVRTEEGLHVGPGEGADLPDGVELRDAALGEVVAHEAVVEPEDRLQVEDEGNGGQRGEDPHGDAQLVGGCGVFGVCMCIG